MVLHSSSGLLTEVAAGAFSNLRGLFVFNDDLYVADTGHDCVVFLVGGSGIPVELAIGAFTLQQGICVDLSGNVIVTNSGSDNILMITVGGGGLQVLLATSPPPGLFKPIVFSVDASGNIFISAEENGAVWMLVAVSAARPTRIGDPTVTGLPKGLFAAANGQVFIADSVMSAVFVTAPGDSTTSVGVVVYPSHPPGVWLAPLAEGWDPPPPAPPLPA